MRAATGEKFLYDLGCREILQVLYFKLNMCATNKQAPAPHYGGAVLRRHGLGARRGSLGGIEYPNKFGAARICCISCSHD